MLGFPFSKTLFWDVNIECLDIEVNKNLIIQRVLMRGGLSDVQTLFRLYDRDVIVAVIKNAKDFDKVTHHFCSSYFNIRKEEMNAPSEYYK